MKIIYKEVKDNIVQITTSDERWYRFEVDPMKYEYVPSITWIASHYPKGYGFYKWLASKGWDEAEAIKSAAGDKGSKVHNAVNDLIDGKEVVIDAKYINNSTGQEEELSVEEYDCLMSFVDWFREAKPISLAKDMVVFNKEYNYAGTLDWIGIINQVDKKGKEVKITPELWLLDFKTSKEIWAEHELQISAYKHCLMEWLLPLICAAGFEENQKQILQDMKIGILQLGYGRNKKGFKFTEIQDKFDLFLSAQKIWANEAAGQAPLQKDYPTKLSLTDSSTDSQNNYNSSKMKE